MPHCSQISVGEMRKALEGFEDSDMLTQVHPSIEGDIVVYRGRALIGVIDMKERKITPNPDARFVGFPPNSD